MREIGELDEQLEARKTRQKPHGSPGRRLTANVCQAPSTWHGLRHKLLTNGDEKKSCPPSKSGHKATKQKEINEPM